MSLGITRFVYDRRVFPQGLPLGRQRGVFAELLGGGRTMIVESADISFIGAHEMVRLLNAGLDALEDE